MAVVKQGYLHISYRNVSETVLMDKNWMNLETSMSSYQGIPEVCLLLLSGVAILGTN